MIHKNKGILRKKYTQLRAQTKMIHYICKINSHNQQYDTHCRFIILIKKTVLWKKE